MGYEFEIEREVKARLSRFGVDMRKVSWVNRVGAPDRLIFIDGGVWVEFKASPRAGVSAHQKKEIEFMKAAGMDVRIVCSMSDAEILINEIHNRLLKKGRGRG